MLSTFKIIGRISGEEISFKEWYPFNEALEHAPTEKGVYCMRFKANICRVKGESDIAYIGSTNRTLKYRFMGYLHPSKTQRTNTRINLFAKTHELEVSFLAATPPSLYENLLLDKYYSEHDELPPLNRAGVEKHHLRP